MKQTIKKIMTGPKSRGPESIAADKPIKKSPKKATIRKDQIRVSH